MLGLSMQLVQELSVVTVVMGDIVYMSKLNNDILSRFSYVEVHSVVLLIFCLNCIE